MASLPDNDAGFLGVLPGGRMALLLRALGIARYEKWAASANKRRSASKQQLEVTRAQLAEARRTTGDVAELEPAWQAIWASASARASGTSQVATPLSAVCKLPKVDKGSSPEFPFLYPDEYVRLMRCVDISFEYRVLWGFVLREGPRISTRSADHAQSGPADAHDSEADAGQSPRHLHRRVPLGPH